MKDLTPRARELLKAVHPLFYLLHRIRQEPSRSLSDELHQRVCRLDSEDVRGVDEALRRDDTLGGELPRMETRQLDAFAALSPVALALLSCHSNGFLRQGALVRLAGGEDVDTVWPFVLVRLNDWVAPVRQAALRAAQSALPRVSLEQLVRHLPLLEALRRSTRADHSSFLASARARLCQPEALAWLADHLDEVRGPSRREAFRLLLEGPPTLARSAVVRGLEDPDPVVQRIAVEHVEPLVSEEELPGVLERMECSRTMFVRREAYALHARRFPMLGEVKIREALMDPHPAIRDFAQRRLSDTVEVAGLYRRALRELPLLPGALAGLGETGRTSDVPLLEPFLTHPRVAVRRAAVTAMGRLDGDGAAPLLRECFLDPAPSVCRAAAHALSQHSGRFSEDWLRQCLRGPGAAPWTLRAALHLTDTLPRFEALAVLLDATQSQDERFREEVQEALRRWLALGFRRFTASPSPQRLQALREALRTARDLAPALVRELDHQLRAFEP